MVILVVNNYKNQKKFRDRIKKLRDALKREGQDKICEVLARALHYSRKYLTQ